MIKDTGMLSTALGVIVIGVAIIGFVFIYRIIKKGNMYRTLAGPFTDKASALLALSDIKSQISKKAYLVDLNKWCSNRAPGDQCPECN